MFITPANSTSTAPKSAAEHPTRALWDGWHCDGLRFRLYPVSRVVWIAWIFAIAGMVWGAVSATGLAERLVWTGLAALLIVDDAAESAAAGAPSGMWLTIGWGWRLT